MVCCQLVVWLYLLLFSLICWKSTNNKTDKINLTKGEFTLARGLRGTVQGRLKGTDLSGGEGKVAGMWGHIPSAVRKLRESVLVFHSSSPCRSSRTTVPATWCPQGGAFPRLPTNALTITARGHLLGDFKVNQLDNEDGSSQHLLGSSVDPRSYSSGGRTVE